MGEIADTVKRMNEISDLSGRFNLLSYEAQRMAFMNEDDEYEYGKYVGMSIAYVKAASMLLEFLGGDK